MREFPAFRPLVVGLILALSVIGCSSEDGSTPTQIETPPQTSATTSTSVAATTTPTTGTATTQATDATDGSTRLAQSIATPDGIPIDVHTPPGDPEWPVVLLLHGSPPATMSDVSVIADWIAERGMLVYNVGWIEGGRAGIDGSVVNVACVVAFARETAAEHGGDTSRVTLVGLSAGGWAAAVVALAGDELGGDCPSTSSALPDAFVGISGAYNAAIDGPPAALMADDPEALALLEPLNHIGKNPDLEVWVVHGDADAVIPLAVAERFAQALSDDGYDVELVTLPGAGHEGDLEAANVRALLDAIAAAAAGSAGG